MKKKKRFVPLTRRINLFILITLVIGIGSVSFYFGRSIFNTIDMSTRSNLNQQTGILYTSIENFMLTGNAPIAVNFFNDVKKDNPDFTISLYRSNGVEAFSDNSTIYKVNENIGSDVFIPRLEEDPAPEVVISDAFMEATSAPPISTFRRMEEDTNVLVQTYQPLLNLPKCTTCHGGSHTIRGVIDIRSDITSAVMKQRQSIIISGGLFLGLVVLLGLWLSMYLRNSIIAPVKIIGGVCEGVTQGNFEQRVSIRNHDEIGSLGDTVNSMVQGLHERFMLSKYVSNSTLNSLREDKQGKSASITLFFSDIRGFTTYSERRTPQEIVKYLNEMLNMQTEIITRYEGDVDKYVGDEVVALFAGENSEAAACGAALEIRRELKRRGEEFDGLQVGIGIHTGEVILGMIGSETRADFTVIGDNVNTASRLCSAAKPLQIVISNSTFKKIMDRADVEGPFKLKVKGKEEYLKVYLLGGLHE